MSGDKPEDMEAAKAAAAAKNCKVVLPKPRELFVDIDSAQQKATFERQWPVFLQQFPKAKYDIFQSPSGEIDHFHIYVTIDRAVGEQERILLQALLGSNPMREILSWRRLNMGYPSPTRFFELLP